MIPIAETQVQKLMRILDISEQEALEMIETDKQIDKGAKLFELSAELAEGAKKARQAPRKQNSTPTKREKKVDNDKLHLMKIIQTSIGYNPNTTEFEFINAERECVFNYNGKKYKIVLSCPRS
jgi:hypothetical protein